MAVRELSKRFGATLALDDFSFDVRRGEVHALVGGNGSGKSTFIKSMAGVHQADHGTLRIGGEERDLTTHSPEDARAAGLRFVHQDLGIFPMLSVAENLAMGHGFEHSRFGRIRWRRCRQRSREMLERFQLDVDPVALAGTLSVPQHAVLAIARALQDFDEGTQGVLILDEPTAALPAEEVHILLDTLRRLATSGHAIVLVTHRLDEVRQVADRVTAVRDGQLVGTVETSSLTEATAVELVLGRRLAAPAPVAEMGENQPAVLEARGLRGGPIRGLDLTVAKGEIVGVAGLLGSGRSELLHLLYGAMPLESGELVVDGEPIRSLNPGAMCARGMALVPENRKDDALFGECSARENMTAGHVSSYFRALRLRGGAERREVAGDLTRFTVKAASTETPIEGLSGGNQQKVVLGRWLRLQPKVLLLDEPTQGIDVGAREDVFRLITEAAASGTAVIIVSSEFEELARLCHRVVVLAHGRVAAEQLRPMHSHDLLELVLESAKGLST